MKPIGWRGALFAISLSIVSFNLAYLQVETAVTRFFILIYLIGLFELARLTTNRKAFYSGLLTGFLCGAIQLSCFWSIFGAGAIALWMILAFWIGLFVLLAHVALNRLGTRRAALLLPFLWTGLEYFRSELYYLRFSWLNIGYAFSDLRVVPFHWIGNYGVGFLAACVATLGIAFRRHVQIAFAAVLLIFGALINLVQSSMPGGSTVHVAGIQFEFSDEKPLVAALDKLVTTHSNADIVVLSEYTFAGPVPESLRDWCRSHKQFLVVGAEDPAPGENYFDTAFVIGPSGATVFQQAKCVPIQFFKDGLPATRQALWNSPWGRIGFCVCYDLSYSRVTDELIRQGAQLLIVPTMDVTDWGAHEHWLHTRVAPVRAAEYDVPIFRLASSGISQAVDHRGAVLSTASFPGQGEMLFADLQLPGKGSLPIDRFLAPLSVCVTVLFLLWMIATVKRRRITSPVSGTSA